MVTEQQPEQNVRTVGGALGAQELRIYNSLTHSKDPLKTEGSIVKWYTCGPTVYDAAHIGHARSYVLLDAIRKTLERYFGYTVRYIMNVTDIDDKIIIRARELAAEKEGEIQPEKKQESIHQATREVGRKYEQEFFRDMRRLGVAPPTYTTRVSDYVQEIIRFAERIEEQGYAYRSKGSLYFDVRKYAESHEYPRMCPSMQNREALLNEGEGKLTREEKRHREDFVLWKASKGDEPSWDSKWGPGRPGWHIECSAMAANISGGRIDMHSGGIDLTFPHHDNEIAQSEGAGLRNWVGHFLHTGHLHVEGLKMSKSLKNFIKIEELLEEAEPRQVRLMFLLQKYRDPMKYGKEGLARAAGVEKKIFRFISLHADAGAGNDSSTTGPLGQEEKSVLTAYDATVQGIDAAMKDDFDYPRVVDLVVSLLALAGQTKNKAVHRDIAGYVKHIMFCMGAEVEDKPESADTSAAVELLARFRHTVRSLAKSSAGKGEYFKACDDVRKEMADLGIQVEDASGAAAYSVIKQQ